MAENQHEELFDCIHLCDELLMLMEEDQRGIGACLQGVPLLEHQNVTEFEVEALEEIRNLLLKGLGQ